MGILRINMENIRGLDFGECEVNYPQHEDFLSCSVMHRRPFRRRWKAVCWANLWPCFNRRRYFCFPSPAFF